MPSTEPTGVDTRSATMTCDIDPPADELREEASRAKRAALVAADPKAKSRQKTSAEGPAERPSMLQGSSSCWTSARPRRATALSVLLCTLGIAAGPSLITESR